MAAVVAEDEQPRSRTYQYRKVMKPMLERKRRARINRCLDELKELLVGALQAEGESVSRLEKADVLELTVRHLHKLRRAQQLAESASGERYRAGFAHCATEVSKYITTLPTASIDMSVSTRLVTHLDSCIHQMDSSLHSPPLPHPPGLNILTNYTPPSSPLLNSPPTNSSPSYTTSYTNNNNMSSSSPKGPFPAHIGPLGANYGRWGPSYGSGQQAQPLALTISCKEEPFDLSSGSVWRPW